ncbi:unnamed protein product [Cylindrotheca closterium]|uniref:3-oxo-5-alpha-steroid 4-dehydrogenase C-terminal domain-containing protein n=1 Tax=Cylindrotheca closterium TaxID=2856 RepID=A0AAD2PVA6_9STRA|nr:unnamed protein product [Cylindrotheca closterium]
MIQSLSPILNSGLLNDHTGVLAFNAMQTFLIAAQFKGESETPTPYSKFAQGLPKDEKKRVSSRNGMLLIYVPASMVGLLFVLSSSAYSTPAALMCFIHFLKRDLEVLFLHKYSGTVELGVSQFIGFFYAFITFMICLVSRSEVDPQVLQLGQALFSIGILGNFYHHYLLASLRKNGSAVETKKYHAPTGGLFEFVAAPHYLFEVIGWLGIAFVSGDMTAFLNFGTMTAYLSARSKNQNDWNRKKFDEKEWPSSRKNLVPFIY